MNLSKLSKSELLAKCDELGLSKCKSKTKLELIDLINSKSQNNNQLPPGPSNPSNNIPQHVDEVIINNNVSYFNKDALQFTTAKTFDLIYLDPPYETNRTFTVNSIDDETGFQDLWEDNHYCEWLDKLINHLKLMLQ